MSSDRILSLGVSSRRFACDRCRSQEVRCLRTRTRPDLDLVRVRVRVRCNHCVTANAKCTTGPMLHTRGSEVPKRKHQRQRVTENDFDLQPLLGDKAPAYGLQTPAPALLLTPWSALASPIVAESSISTAFTAATVNTMDSLQWEADGLDLSDRLFADVLESSGQAASSSRNNNQGSLSYVPTLDLQTIMPSEPALFTASAAPPVQQGGDNDDNNSREVSLFTLNSNLSAPNAMATQDPKRTPMQRLSKANVNLVVLLGRINKGAPEVTIDTLVTPLETPGNSDAATHPVDDILNCSKDILELPSLLAESSRRPSAGAPSLVSSGTKSKSKSKACGLVLGEHQRRSTGSGRGLVRSDFSATPSPLNSPCSPISSSPSASTRPARPELDQTTFFLILTAYVHVVRLFVIVFARICDFLQEIADSDNPYVCPILGLSFSKFPLLR